MELFVNQFRHALSFIIIAINYLELIFFPSVLKDVLLQHAWRTTNTVIEITGMKQRCNYRLVSFISSFFSFLRQFTSFKRFYFCFLNSDHLIS